MQRDTTWLSWLAFAAGLYLVISPMILNYSNTVAANNDITVGVIVAIFAFVTAVWGRETAGWLTWMIAIVGVWEISAPFVVNYSGASTPMANAVILGIAITALGVWRGFLSTELQRSDYSTAYFSQERRKKRKGQEKKTEG